MSSNTGTVVGGSTSLKVPAAAALNLSMLDWIVCPGCRGSLAPVGVQPIVDGRLSCQSCGKSYEVLKGVPILLNDVSADDRFTGKNFAEQWRHFHEIGGLGEEFENNQVVDYFHPFDIRNLAGKHVLEAGCGYGRNLLAAKKYGAATVIGFDIGEAALLAKARGCDAVIGDILNPPFARRFDVVFSFGVIHHVSDPDRAMRTLAELAIPHGGACCHSVYSAENNWFLDRVFTPIRMRLFRHLGPQTKHAVSTVVGLISFALFAIAYVPFSLNKRTSSWASRHLYYYDYMILTIRKLGLKQWIGQIFDHLNAPLAAYISRERVERWMKDAGLEHQYIRFRNQNTWNFGGIKP